MKTEFEQLDELYSAIKMVDNLLVESNKKDNGPKQNRFDDLCTAIKNIDKTKLPDEYITSVILYIKAGLISNYTDIMNSINKNLYFPTGIPTVEEIRSAMQEESNE